MNAAAFLFDLSRRGVVVTRRGDELHYRAPKGVLTSEQKVELVQHKKLILDFLSAVPASSSATNCLARSSAVVLPISTERRNGAGTNRVAISTRVFDYDIPWDGKILVGDEIAFDTETALIDSQSIPLMGLASASSGGEHCLIRPDHVGAFVLAHRDRRFIFQNVAFDFWVVVRHLKDRQEHEALRAWWAIADEGRMHDTMILDMLIRLARLDAYPQPRNLAVLGSEYAGLDISKDDPYRLRYGEIVGKDWADVDSRFFEYAIKDPIVTWHVYRELNEQAVSITNRAGVAREKIDRFGVLTEAIQVKGAIALAQITRNGIHLDLSRSSHVHRDYRDVRTEIVNKMKAMPECVGLFKTNKQTGELILTNGQAPSLDQKVLRQILTGIVTNAARESGQSIAIPQTAKGAVSTSTKEWADLSHLHPFIQEWTNLAETAKLCQFFGGLQTQSVHPRYSILVRSGRSSASGPNIQQIPRKGGLREVFVPSPGNLLLTADYSFIELRTLAAVCEDWYGHSTLAEVIRQGTDPHCYTASLLLGMDLGSFMALEQNDPKRFKQLRQNAKALNFGIPGGLGAASLVQYAKATFGVVLTIDQAKEFRRQLTEEVYPELGKYLNEDSMTILARNLCVPVEDCWRQFDWSGQRSPGIAGGIRNIVRGKTLKADGTPYAPGYAENVWAGLSALNRNPEAKSLIRERVAGDDLVKRLFGSGVTTTTGRVRGRVSFSQARNTPFQGLAADGAKLALWNLMKSGFRVVGFVHDEVLVELPDQGGYVDLQQAEQVDQILCRSMEEVTGSVPVACEFALANRWSKDAKKIVRDGKLYPWQPCRGNGE